LWVIRSHEIKDLKILQNSPFLGRELNLKSHEQENITFNPAFITHDLSSTKNKVLDGQSKDLSLIPETSKAFVKPPIFPDWIWKPRSLLFKK
jgi:hypothetical protein